MARRLPATVDFETKEIFARPQYPPEPVGVAIIEPGKRPEYLAWQHPCDNNTTKAKARARLKHLYDNYPILCHHAKFDLDVAHEHLDLPTIPKYGYHDTEFLAFLDNPHAKQLSLKPLSEHYLDMPPDEQKELFEWIENNIYLSAPFKTQQYRIHMGDTKPQGYYKVPPSNLGAFIGYAPGKLVGIYAKGDVIRTRKLFNLLHKKVVDKRNMGAAYERELKLMPILLENEREGVCVNQRGLTKDVKQWQTVVTQIDDYLRRKVKKKELNIDSNEELADALESAGFIDDWVYTEKGNRSVSKENLPQAINSQAIIDSLLYRSKMINAINNFGRPWLKMADATGGRIHCDWSQVRNTDERGKASAGARTGRIQSRPNFQNIPKKIQELALPTPLRKKLVTRDMPNMRKYIVPDNNESLFGHRDYSQQELRILGHFEDGVLLHAYLQDNNLDLHQHARSGINTMLSANFDRKPIKNMGFGLLYGMGIAKLARQMDVDTPTAKTIKQAYLSIFPGLKDLINQLHQMAKDGEPLTTWGGRQYYCEEPQWSTKYNNWQTFEYKLLNYLIQGSAADCTKESIIRVYEACKKSRILITVHDEINQNMPKFGFNQEMKLMKEAMESVEFDVPMLSDGGKSARNWASVKDFTKAEMKKYGI